MGGGRWQVLWGFVGRGGNRKGREGFVGMDMKKM
jgi:hypothetical protein